ncbi:Gll3345 protein [Gulosibacter sp. 10]|nr:Gll3345 protein [Gulosibacter sp. 10]
MTKVGARLAYGEKIDFGHEQIIPVAFWAGGSAEGQGGLDPDRRAEGGGEGGVAIPLGAYVGDDYGTRFRPNIIALLATLTPLVMVAGWALPRLVKALKK